jgi:acyl-CoA thioesterase I
VSVGAIVRRYAVLVVLVNLMAAVAGAAHAETIKLLVLGDSIAAGFGLPASEALPARLEAKLRADGHDVRVINAGVSGDTTAAGLARLDWVLGEKPEFAIVELGANDMLRGVDPSLTRRNLDAILSKLAAAKVPALLMGMKAGRNLGTEYVNAFEAIYPELAQKHGIALYPFVLDGIALDPALNQGDGIHPNARGVAVMVDRMAPYVVRLLQRSKD